MGTKNYISRGVSMIYRQGNRFVTGSWQSTILEAAELFSDLYL